MPLWRRTLYTIWVTQFVAVLGFSFIMAFIPLYVQELGVTDVREVSLWAGLITSSQAFSMALMAPVWGMLADRYGRKLMVLRATFAGAVIMTLMGFVTNVQQLLVLRILQGIMTGTVAAATTLVASQAPREKAGEALGSLQTAFFVAVSLGPLLGGISGDRFGFRPSFWITGSLLFLSGCLVAIFIREDFHPAPAATARNGLGSTLHLVLASGGLVAIFAVRILLRIGSRSVSPVLPLFVQSLLPTSVAVATTTGMISAASALGSAFGSPLIGRWGDRVGHRPLLMISAVAASILFIPQALVQSAWALIFWQAVSGFAVGGTLSTLTALLARLAPEGREGAVFGLDSSAVAGANAIGPMAGAVVAANLGLRAPFIFSALMLGLGAVGVFLWVREKRHAPPLLGAPIENRPGIEQHTVGECQKGPD